MGKNGSGNYTAVINGKAVKVCIKRLLPFVLTLVLIKEGYTFMTSMIGTKETDSDTEQYITMEDRNLALIESIIKQNPHILYDVHMDTYEIQLGDTLGGIAEKCGNALKRICSLNGIDSKKTIYPGTELKVEIIKEKSELDKKIASLESYLDNYVFSSPIAVAAKAQSEDQNNQLAYYRTVLYGSPQKFAKLDPSSYYGMYFTNYLKFHESTEHSEEEKLAYVTSLMGIATDLETKLNLNGTVEMIVPYETYYIYLQNRTTEYDTLVEQHRTIYG